MKQIRLKPGKEKSLLRKHPWIFSGAIATTPSYTPGDFLQVYDFQDRFLGTAYFNPKTSIAGRMVTFDERAPLDAIREHLDEAILMRKKLMQGETNAYRLVNGEGDRLPGLTVDLYNDVVVLQISTLGMDLIRNWLIEYFIQKIKPKAIYEKSALQSRRQEGLSDKEEWLYGDPIPQVEVIENGLKFVIDVINGQKTGFFLDQRLMRAWVRGQSKGKRVLNAFSYSGGFSINAQAGGALVADSVDISKQAMEWTEKNFTINGLSPGKMICDDVFDFLKTDSLNYDLIILDPPAFAKKKGDIIAACRGYKELNRTAMQKIPKGALLLTCSCSYYVDEALFQKVLYQAAVEAKRDVRIVGKHQQAEDHPINIFHPEGDYLKSFILYID